MKKHLFRVLNLSSLSGHWNDAKIASIFLLGPAGPDDPTKFYNPLWCALGLGGISNEDSDCASWGLIPFNLAI